MANTGESRHDQVVRAVEQAVHQVGRDMLQGAVLEGCLRLWREFAEQTDLSRTRKTETWAAALVYAYERMRLGGFSQEDIATAFGTSPITVSQKYRRIAETLNLVLLDPRYVPEAMRAKIRREEGPFPKDLPLTEAPMGWWRWQPPEVRFETRERDPLRRAQDLVYKGWDAWDDLETTERCFREALRLDPTLADAHNGLAEVAIAREDLSQAEAHYRRAYELAREALGTESPRAYHWWGEIETRPYMRARAGLAVIYWMTDRYAEAIAEYEALLKLNPNDNQGARYLIGPLHQLAGDLKAALRAYRRYEKDYPEDVGDPHYTFCWGLVLYEAGHRREAVIKWREALFQNIYIAPLLLGERLPEEEIWTFTDLQWPEYAEEYVELYGILWDRAPEALACLRRLWADPEVQADVEHWVTLGQELEASSGSVRHDGEQARKKRRQLREEQRAVEGRAPSRTALRRVLGT
ncbi:MAG: tetratricopeptide repeat protein [Candidatus Bipolaricaulia bacterium]